MDDAIISRFYKLFDKEMPEGIMPMSIHKLGNSLSPHFMISFE